MPNRGIGTRLRQRWRCLRFDHQTMWFGRHRVCIVCGKEF